ncbi:sugar transport protein 5 isoform X2 [Eutrema salsugineum]|uniref:sugar transport protein 5 isoform X2 n=1 Tax=Eutrema salsugineum TaxID=72664 RepID=UPI000CED7ED1|nr:sugar transport protein 5 isoform X2 [Eutrema salsugineum]
MPIGGLALDVPGSGGNINAKITTAVVITCVVAASSGLIFGYDIGISGGVTTMEPFLEKFFPSVLAKASEAKTNVYCVYDSQLLTAFTSSLYVAGLVASLVASRLTAAYGRRTTIILGGFTFFFGAVINGFAANIAMLISGRILLGFGVGFTNQAAPVYLSEVAPPQWRGAFNSGFNFFIGFGVVAANLINYATANHRNGWRISLGLAAVPAAIMTVGCLLISDTPSSLLARGKHDQARASLFNLRGTENRADVEAELAELVKSSQLALEARAEPFRTILERRYRPQLVVAVAIPFFQQLTGITVNAFYAPVLFQSVGFGSGPALIATLILGLVNLGSILVSTMVIDRFGRRFLFIAGGIQMFVCQIIIRKLNFLSIKHVKNFDMDLRVTKSFASTRISLSLCIPNDKIPTLASNDSEAESIIRKLILPYHKNTITPSETKSPCCRNSPNIKLSLVPS